jgi:hypothetical protein
VSGAEWALRGTVFIACNCDYGCPCNFNARPTQGYCEGQWTWHIDEGRFGGVDLDGLTLTIAVKWPGAIHEGDGNALILFDERADEAQQAALRTLVGGDVGGPWGVLAWTWPTIDGPHLVPYDVVEDGVGFRVRAGDLFELESEPIRNPVTQAEVTPGAVLPQGIILKRPDFGSSKRLRVGGKLEYEYSGRYTAVGPFEYSGP